LDEKLRFAFIEIFLGGKKIYQNFFWKKTTFRVL
jgi:hypothetical protein